MARKSRKNIEAEATLETKQAKERLGGYVRLSALDRKQKGDSIENQQAIIKAYVAERTELKLVEMYIDNGATGQNFDRPAFQRMLADMESGRISGCISKDLSRLGRNSIDTGYYIEKFFPTRGFRYIAITDNYDSADGNSGGIMVSLKNLINETYALEVGRKVHKTRQMNIKDGKFVGGFAPYGFAKDPDDSHHLIPDPYAAEVVKSIFQMYTEGRGVTFILNYLNEQEIKPPNLYRHTNSGNTKQAAKSNTFWTNVVIYEIIGNPIYCGDMVQGRSTTKQYKTTWKGNADLIITPNTHEAIVSRELFAAVQARKGTIKKSDKPAPVNIFAKKIFCGHCGYAIKYEKRSDKPNSTYYCTSRKTHGKDACIPVNINGEELKAYVFEILRKQAAAFADSRKQTTVAPTAANDKLMVIKSEMDRAGGFLKGLYESLIVGDITGDEYKEMKSAYEIRIIKLTEQESELREAARLAVIESERREKTSVSYGALHNASELTPEIVDALVERILVFSDKSIEISFKFSDETSGGIDYGIE